MAFKELVLDTTEDNSVITHLHFDTPGQGSGAFLISVSETEINSGEFYLLIEHHYLDTKFRYSLDKLIDEKNIKAHVYNGVLTVSLPKRKKQYFEIDVGN